MPIRCSSPKAVRAALKLLAGATLATAVVAVPTTAQAVVADSGGYPHSIPATALAGTSDAAQQSGTGKPFGGPGVSDAAQQHPGYTGGPPTRTSYQPAPAKSIGASITPLTISSQSLVPSHAFVTANMTPAKDLGITLDKPALHAVSATGVGFDVSSAAIGAGGAAALLVLAVGGALAITPKRRLVDHA